MIEEKENEILQKKNNKCIICLLIILIFIVLDILYVLNTGFEIIFYP